MQDKLGKLKQRKEEKKHGGDDDEIKSNDSDAWIDREPVNPSHAKRKELLNDPFF